MKHRIGVIGRDGDIPAEVRGFAESVGEDVARSGCVLVCGGRGGVMEAACRGAKKAGGLTVGILQTLRRGDANPFVDVAITSGMGLARNALVVSSSDVLIAINGREGTLSEICLALAYGKPVVVVEGSGGVADAIDGKLAELSIEKKVHRTCAKDAVKLAVSLISESA
jgi:hypothetical protein